MLQTAAVRRKPKNWLERLTPEQRAEIEGIKAAWRAGELQSSGLSLANSLVAACRERGYAICGVDGVRAWLSKD